MEELELHPSIKTEAAKGRTYGECVMDELTSVKMIEGVFMTTLHIKDKPKRLSRKEALKYYTHKLRVMWARTEG
ncbi:MAG: hypothetical protein PHQ90_01605 [Sulfuricurvum sp.]|uniref:hypothetical protein n=1 Tax=Sulfuricurvum sp. TaxID=2025608 RepID=UPI0026268739|nr:hypothetical protein [Sulfuricurvum sp.]MDD2367965.1 hypothetical protein [Sulfuricurvum sp.]MDD2949164.1 hypothetical protein [Sulfuricurvum sp.]MDD5118771.1 hypothetical protein [Sulfuricurvum sp.]